MKTLKEMVGYGGHHAERILITERNGGLTPIYHLFCPEGDLVVACPWQNESQKYMAVEAVRKLSHQHHATAALFVAEAWTISRPHGCDMNEKPSEAEDRKEIVMAAATDGLFTEVGVWFVIRDADGKIVSLEQESPDDVSGVFGGRMLDGLIEVQTGHA